MRALPLSGDILVEDLVREFPSAAGFLRQWGLICLQCGEPIWGTLLELIESKHHNPEEVLTALNDHLKERTSENS